ncbi:RagB/SusD family nutrient uptake outer membrane protein [Marinilongibacter aquaticus]|uniref:RagB/SusD family nutrient uptake outer membrane protein n=1 Tax=Marinilongibacter aquaticus TaxID=2975157 RepID=UPI0021BD0441|nr:RagB/SusD family nutrient uptake outer membrane protein [Marinilongibacter aquaticus]UBM58663.1 RagB/SusD family nutrient uptake outer membrane protein [Marinilongibacter aquaticus]
MKFKIFISIIILGLLSACKNSLDLYPLAQPSAEKWYSNETEIQLALNDLYRIDWWQWDEDLLSNQYLSDDGFYRQTLSSIKSGTVTSQWSFSIAAWRNGYKAIARANRAIEAMNRPETQEKVSASKLNQYLAESRFHRAAQYAKLVNKFGDVVYSNDVINLEDAYVIGREAKETVIPKIYEDFDFAIDNLPANYPASAVKRATKGAALALKARFALSEHDYETAEAAARACIDLGEYDLFDDFGGLFLQSTKNANEVIFSIPRSVELNITVGNTSDKITRNSGGYAATNPTWDLFCSFLCTDGKPIDQSPLYNPHDPFKNRDPRCTQTIVEFGTAHLGFIYDPHPEALTVRRLSTDTDVKNNDNRVNAQFASFNGLVWKKGIDNSWLENGRNIAPDQIVIRYADVLLMYAEAKIEQNDIDESVLSAINQVRARAYKADVENTAKYPAVTETDQSALRKVLRMERRMEFAAEGLRYMDIVRWKIAGKVLNRPIYGLLDPSDLQSKVVDAGLWFFPGTPSLDMDGIPDFSQMAATGLIKNLVNTSWNDRQYLWPIPAAEIQINANMRQNEGY